MTSIRAYRMIAVFEFSNSDLHSAVYAHIQYNSDTSLSFYKTYKLSQK